MPCPYAVTFAGCKWLPIHETIDSVDCSLQYNSDIHSRRSIRLPGYDYSQPGAYFVTICTAGRECVFGEVNIEKQSFRPSRLGELVIECWGLIPVHFPFVKLDAFVLMPNHSHGILQIIDSHEGETNNLEVTVRTEAFGKPVRGSIPTIIRSFKSAVSRRFADERLGTIRPVWQRNYYERVIRSECDRDDVRKYILENLAKWSKDPENPAVMKSSSPP